jgi:hypothetical protein
MDEARILLEALREKGEGSGSDPWSDPEVIAGAIKDGLLDTPHFKGNEYLCGNIVTSLIEGAWYAIDPSTGEKINEETRIKKLKKLWQE